jgi:FkbM family methyltransferase
MIISGMFRPGVRHVIRCLKERDYRNWCLLSGRYARCRRYVEKKIATPFGVLRVSDIASFLSTYREMFVNRIYQFEASTQTPLILDIGANIGLSVLFFKQLYPDARVVAYEADPYIFSILEENIRNTRMSNVTLVNRAVWNASGYVTFRVDRADSGRVVVDGDENTVSVKTVDIREILSAHPVIDFLKMDIEGAERCVLPAATGMLSRVNHIFVEYHSVVGEDQQLDTVIETLAGAGYRLAVQSLNTPTSPFVLSSSAQTQSRTFDVQLNIWGRRESLCQHGGTKSSVLQPL